jgi:hypothetical protein
MDNKIDYFIEVCYIALLVDLIQEFVFTTMFTTTSTPFFNKKFLLLIESLESNLMFTFVALHESKISSSSSFLSSNLGHWVKPNNTT